MNSKNTNPKPVVLITGGSGGIGKACAKHFLRAGFSVAIGDLKESDAKTVAEELAAAENALGRVIGIGVDVTDVGSYENYFDESAKQLGPITHVVLGAGVMWVGPFTEEPENALEMQLAVNLAGVIRGIKIASTKITGPARLITIASAGSLIAPPGEATYAATKHGVLGFLKAAREELRGSGKTVTAIMPGVVDTPLAAGTAAGAAKLLTPDSVGLAVVNEATRNKPRFEVTLPGFIGPLNRFVNILPRPLRDILLRAMVPNQVKQTNSGAREGYEERFKKGAE